MKRKILSIILTVLTLFSFSACGKKTRTELPMENIRSMMINGAGDVYLLTDNGIRCYSLSGDKKVEYLYNSDEIEEAELEIVTNGTEITYSSLYVDRLIAAGDTGITMLGRYMTNSLGKDCDLYVAQDAADLNYAAACFVEIERDSKAKTSVLNGVGITSEAVYLRLNRAIQNRKNYGEGLSYNYLSGEIKAAALPEDVTAAFDYNDKTYFLTENKTEIKLVCDGETVFDYDRLAVADAFVSGTEVYAVYKNGTVTSRAVDGEETEFKKYNVKFSDVNDALLYDGSLYWFDDEGVKTV